MKVNQEEIEVYKPVTITLETKEEFLAMFDLVNLCHDNVQKVSNMAVSDSTEEDIKEFFANAFSVLHPIKEKMDEQEANE